MYTSVISTAASLSLLLLLHPQSTLASCAHGTTLYRREAAEGKVEISEFDYGTVKGPTNWHSLSPENEKCATGKSQSPIILDDSITVEPHGFVKIEHIEPTEDIPFENLGSTVEVIVEGKTIVGGSTYNLKQFHFHTPSEHRINDEYFPIEVHMVHEAEDDPEKIAVVGLLFQLTDWEPWSTLVIQDVISHVETIATPGTVTEIPHLDFTRLIEIVNSSHFYNYQGSLTTPPCSEDVTFLVATHPIPLHVSKYNALKSVLKANARFSQSKLGEENLLELSAKHLSK